VRDGGITTSDEVPGEPIRTGEADARTAGRATGLSDTYLAALLLAVRAPAECEVWRPRGADTGFLEFLWFGVGSGAAVPRRFPSPRRATPFLDPESRQACVDRSRARRHCWGESARGWTDGAECAPLLAVYGRDRLTCSAAMQAAPSAGT